MVYNLTGIVTNSTGVVPFMQGVNEFLMFGWLGLIMLVSIVAILGFGFYFATQNIKTSLAAAAFISFGLSIFLTAMEILSTKALFITAVLAAGAIALSLKD